MIEGLNDTPEDGDEGDGLVGGIMDLHSLCVTVRHHMEAVSDTVDELRGLGHIGERVDGLMDRSRVSARWLGVVFFLMDRVEEGVVIAKKKGHLPVDMVGAPLTMLNDFLRGDREDDEK